MKSPSNPIGKLVFIGPAVSLIFLMCNLAQAQVPSLFRDTNRSGVLRAKPVEDPTVIRRKNIIVDVPLLRNRQRGRVSLALFEGRGIVIDRVAIEEEKARLVWKGRIANQPGSSATFVVVGNVVVGNIFTSSGNLYQIRYLGNGVHSFLEIDRSKFPNEAEPSEVPRTPPRGTPGGPSGIAAARDSCTTDPAGEIDVLVVFSATTRIAAAGEQAMQAEILLAIEESNDSYNNSGINQRLRLAHMEEVNYPETGKSATDKERLRSPNDGVIDNIHTLRNTFAADVVLLEVESLDNCGETFIMTSVSNAFEKNAFGVVRRSCATGNFSFGHELGHIMGARHDWAADDANNSPFEFNHGFVKTRPASAAVRPWRTIMGVNGRPNTARIQFWSNPSVNDPNGGEPTGESNGSRKANNAATLNTTAPTVANFRCGLPDRNKIWTSVGSDGRVDEADAGKIFFDHGIAQMGQLVMDPIATRRRRLLSQSRPSAVIRYNVIPTETLFRVSGGLELKLNYLASRTGARVVAKLISVDLSNGAEATLVTFDSNAFPSSNNYQVQSANQCGTGTDVPLDFQRKAYYVEVTLSTGSANSVGAAGVKMIKVSKADCE